MSTEELTTDQAAVETMLALLAAAPAQLDRDQLLYGAGVRAAEGRARRTQRCWMASTAAASFLAVALAGVLLVRVDAHFSPQHTEIVGVPNAGHAVNSGVEGESISVADRATQDRNRDDRHADHPAQYLRMRKLAFAQATDEWPISSPAPTQDPVRPPRAPSGRALLDELLGS